MHIVWMLANNSTAPYFNWFAEQASKDPAVKMSFICLHSEKPRMIEDMKAYGYNCYWIKYDYNNRKSQMISSFFKVRSLLKKLKPDVVHTHLFDDSLIGLLAAKYAGVKHRFITKGDTGFHYYYAPKWVRFDKLNNKFASYVVAISEESKQFIIEMENADKDKVHLIHHGIPIKQISAYDEKDKAAFIQKWNLSDKKVIGTIARFIEWKGYKTIVSVAELLCPEYPDIRFLFVGKGPGRKEIEDLVNEKKLQNNVIFVDWIEPKHIAALYRTIDIYLHAASYEPFGLVIAEAMANEVPVISTSTGAAKDAIKNGENGYLCDDVASMVSAIQQVLQNNIGNAMGKAARATAEKMFPIELMYQKHMELYKQALAGK